MKKIIIAMTCVFLTGFVVTGCSCTANNNNSPINTTANVTNADNNTKTDSTANNTNNDSANNSIVGTWKYDKGFEYDADFTYTFNPNGTGKLNDKLNNMDYNFTYEIKGNKLVYTLEGTSTKEFDYSINGDTLLVIDSKGRNIYHIKEK